MSETEKRLDDGNPYCPPTILSSNPQLEVAPGPRQRYALMGAMWSMAAAFPLSGLMALVFRFPIPFVGYLSGVQAILPAMFAVVVYGVFFGGLILVGLLGASGGIVVAKFTPPRYRRRAVQISSLAITTACLFVLAILDTIIGPW